MSKQEKTLGEKRCHIDFNPSNDNGISQFKRKIADAIDFIEDFRNECKADSEVHRCISICQTELETAQMYGVKAIAKTL